MASTFTDLGLELMATGENAGTWGTKTNANLSLIEQLTGGVLQVSIAGGAGTTALTIADGALTGTAQQRIIELTGTISGNRIVTFPLLTETFYIIKNGTAGSHTVQLKAASGSGATVTFATGNKGYKLIYLDGVATNTGLFEAPLGEANEVTLTGTETLTNKTLTTPILTTPIANAGIQLKNGASSAGFLQFFEDSDNGTNTLKLIGPAATGDVTVTLPAATDTLVGKATTDTLTNKTLTAPILTTPKIGTSILDTGGNELVLLTATGSAVNEFTLANAASGNGPRLSTTGETNVDLDLLAKGTGHVTIRGNTNPGSIQLNCEQNSHGIKLTSPAHSANQSYELKFPTGNVTAERFLKVASVSGSGTTGIGQLSFAEVSGGTAWQAVKTSGFTAVAGEGYFINTAGGAIEMDLPAGTLGDEISFIDYGGTFDSNALTIDPNGSEKIAGSTASLTVSVERAANTLVYVDGTQGWLLKNK